MAAVRKKEAGILFKKTQSPFGFAGNLISWREGNIFGSGGLPETGAAGSTGLFDGLSPLV